MSQPVLKSTQLSFRILFIFYVNEVYTIENKVDPLWPLFYMHFGQLKIGSGCCYGSGTGTETEPPNLKLLEQKQIRNR